MRFGIDTGGTFTDLVLEDDDGSIIFAKVSTNPDDPTIGVLNVLALAADRRGQSLREMLRNGELLIHGTTHAINAVITGRTARTALLTTAGHEDILVFREGGRSNPYDYQQQRPRPYIPRHLTFGIQERIYADGRILLELDEHQVFEIAAELRRENVEAIAVCLLWSIVNPVHELRVLKILEAELPGVPVTVSHELNPTMREYRRASATAIDASLKPIMTSYLDSLELRLREQGFAGRLLVVTSGGGVLDASILSKAPIHSINSGPAMAPIAARYYAARDVGTDTAIVGDVGGTTLDVSLIRRGRIGRTREKWIGPRYSGHMTGFHSVDVSSIGAGGGSIAHVDKGGLLHVGPESAGAHPGPVCFGRGGTRPTLTDAHLVLGRLDANYFLGGEMALDTEGARRAIAQYVAEPLGVDLDAAAAAIVNVASENMLLAIEDIAAGQGIDPREATYVAAGGAAGLNAVTIGRRLGCRQVVIPESVATLSAAGALMSELTADFSTVSHVRTDAFDVDAINAALASLRARAQEFIDCTGNVALNARIEFSFEARYSSQMWEIEVPLPFDHLHGPGAPQELRDLFEQLHGELYAFTDPASDLTFTQWNARAICRVRDRDLARTVPTVPTARHIRLAHMPGDGRIDVPIWRLESMPPGQAVVGPAILESPLTTVVVDSGATARRTPYGSVVIEIERLEESRPRP